MAYGQDRDLLKKLYQIPMLRPKLNGVSQVDPKTGALFYSTGDVVNPGNGEVLQVGSQLRDYLSDLPDNRFFQKEAKRGKFGQDAMTMLGAPGRGRNTSSQNPFDASASMQPDVGASLQKIRKVVNDGQDEQQGPVDEKGRAKGFTMLGGGMFGMPSTGPRPADRMPYKDVLSSSAGVDNSALGNIPGVTLSDASRYNDGTLKQDDSNLSPQQKQDAQKAKIQEMLSMAGNRSLSFDPEGGKFSVGSAPRENPQSMKDRQQAAVMDSLMQMLGTKFNQAAASPMGQAVGNMGVPLPQMPVGPAGPSGPPQAPPAPGAPAAARDDNAALQQIKATAQQKFGRPLSDQEAQAILAKLKG